MSEGASAPFAGVAEHVVDELEHVLVGEAVEDVLAVFARSEEPFATEQLKALGHGGHGVATVSGDFGDATFACGEEMQQAEAGRVTGRTEHRGGAIDDRARIVRASDDGVVIRVVGLTERRQFRGLFGCMIH